MQIPEPTAEDRARLEKPVPDEAKGGPILTGGGAVEAYEATPIA